MTSIDTNVSYGIAPKLWYSDTIARAPVVVRSQVNVRVERSPEFWRSLIAHPAVAHVGEGLSDIGEFVSRDNVIPMASESGGYVFCQVDVLGRVYDLHAAYKPEGRGMEASAALKQCLNEVPGDLFIVSETANPMSRPPKSFGFRVASDWRASPVGPIRTWAVTRDEWQRSPAFRKASQWHS